MSKVVHVFRSTRVRAAVVALVLTVSGVTVMARMDHRTASERAKSWVASHRDVLPQTLAEYAAYPAEYQRAIFDALTPSAKSRLWQAQLGAMLSRTDLNAAQRAFITQSRAQATPASFEPSADHPDVCPGVGTLFTDTRTRKMFNQLGTAVSPAHSWRPALVSMTEFLRSKITTSAEGLQCNCRNQGWCECGLLACDTSAACAQNDSCGCIWSSQCNGMCDIGSSFAPATATTTTTTSNGKK